MKPSFSLFAIALAGAPLAGQGAEPLPHAPAGVVSGTFGLDVVDGRTMAMGPDYKARFEPGAVTFTPALGMRTPTNLPLGLSFVSGARGGAPLWADPTAEPAIDGLTVHYEHGPVVERYDVQLEGIEQSFVFHTLPAGAGDLVVRLDLATELRGELVDRGYGGALFAIEGVGGVSVGAVTGIDADGATTAGALRLDGDALELVLPAWFVDAARLPLVVDPFVGSAFSIVGSDTNDDGDPDVAYDLDTDRYLAVWERRFSIGDQDIRGRRFTAAGTLLGNGLQIEVDDETTSANPKVAGNNFREKWVVVWQQQPSIFSPFEVAARSVNTTLGAGAVGPELIVASSAQGCVDPDVGGDRTILDDDVIVVWRDNGVGVRSRQVQIAPDGSLSTFLIRDVAVDGGGDVWVRPRISKTSGHGGRYLTVFQNTQDDRLSARAMNRDGVLLGTQNDDVCGLTFPISDIGLHDVDGDGDIFAVVWEYAPVGLQKDIRGRHVSFLSGDLELGALQTIHDDDEDETEPAIAYTGDHFVLSWIEETGAFGSFPSTWAYAIDPFSMQPLKGPYLETSFEDHSSVALASRYSGGDDATEGALPDVMFVWESRGSSQSDVDASYFETATNVDELAPGCGAGLAYAPAAFDGNSNFAMHLQGAPASTPAFLGVSFSSTPTACGSCTIIPDIGGPSTVMFSTPTDALGRATVSVPIPPGTAPLSVYCQWAVQGASCPAFGVDLSSGLSFDVVVP